MPVPKPENEEKRLEALRHFQLLDSPAEQSFDDITRIASTVCGTPIALMTLVDDKRQWFKSSVGMVGTQTPREQAFCSYTIMGNGLFIVEDAMRDARFSTNPLVTSDPHIRFYAGAPLVDSSGFALGSICVIDREPRVLTSEQQAALEALSRQAISLMEFRQISAQLAEALSEIETLQEFLPICAHCKSLRNDEGYWGSVEAYFEKHTAVSLSHGICPACVQEHFPEVYAKMQAKK